MKKVVKTRAHEENWQDKVAKKDEILDGGPTGWRKDRSFLYKWVYNVGRDAKSGVADTLFFPFIPVTT